MKNTTKTMVAILVLAIVALGLYLDSRPVADDAMTDKVDSTGAMSTTTQSGVNTNTDGTSGSNTVTTTSKDGKTITKTVVSSTPAKNPFPNTQWVWKYTTFANKSKSTTPNNERFVLKFGANGQLTSTTDCNSISGSYVTKINEGIAIGPFIATMMACTGETLQNVYTQQLDDSVMYSLPTKAELNLQLANNAGTMVFMKKSY